MKTIAAPRPTTAAALDTMTEQSRTRSVATPEAGDPQAYQETPMREARRSVRDSRIASTGATREARRAGRIEAPR